ncbi:MAG: type II toxin-antitoxin system Phd/YefM family antitoxin [Lachnospiraceae bacterium]|nr:type II toxin-antitoxin system Phd/YefM family antitoxin [Lachnospiraceae bacterium]
MLLMIPNKDLKDTESRSELSHSIDEPIYITPNGHGDMALMSIEISEEKIEQGKTKEARNALASVREKYGL